MTVREATPSDFPAIRALHEAGAAPFPFPAFEDRSTMAVLVAEDGGRIVGAVAARRAAEIVVTMDGGWRTPRMRWAMAEAFQREMGPVMERLAVDCAYAWIAPTMRGFIRRVGRSLGWRKSDWVCMEHEVKPQ